MTTKKFDSDFDERGLLPYPVIVAATKGDPDAMKIVLQNYDAQIVKCTLCQGQNKK